MSVRLTERSEELHINNFIVAEFFSMELTRQSWGMFFSVTYQDFFLNFAISNSIYDMNHKMVIDRLIFHTSGKEIRYKPSTYYRSNKKEKN